MAVVQALSGIKMPSVTAFYLRPGLIRTDGIFQQSTANEFSPRNLHSIITFHVDTAKTASEHSCISPARQELSLTFHCVWTLKLCRARLLTIGILSGPLT